MDGAVKWASIRAFPKGTMLDGNVIVYVVYQDQGDDASNRQEVYRIFRKNPALPVPTCPIQVRLGEKPRSLGRLELTEAGKIELQEIQACPCTSPTASMNTKCLA